jgi:hypothetical protein
MTQQILRSKLTQDLTGKTFARLTVVEFAGYTEAKHAQWACKCICGADKTVLAANLKRGAVKSCGCLMADELEKRKASAKTRPAEYTVWANMLQRCSNPKNQSFARYGGRGIKVCERWRSFDNFIADMGFRPSDRHSIDRIDNDGDYEPSNCRWATIKEQTLNTSRNKRLTFDGRSMTISEWSDATGLHVDTIACRLKRGWSVEKTLTAAVGPQGQSIKQKVA